MALTDARLFPAYLIVLVWGVLTVFEGGEPMGLLMIIVLAGLFGWRMHALFNQRK